MNNTNPYTQIHRQPSYDGDHKIFSSSQELSYVSDRVSEITSNTISITNNSLSDFPIGSRLLLITTYAENSSLADTVGNWEYVIVDNHKDGKLVLDKDIVKNYNVENYTFIAKIPRYKKITVNTNVELSCAKWNGDQNKLQGVIALYADKIDINGSINASGKGYRGGDFHFKKEDGSIFYQNSDGSRGESIHSGIWNVKTKFSIYGCGGGGIYNRNVAGTQDLAGAGGGAGYGSNGYKGATFLGGEAGSSFGLPFFDKIFMGPGGGQGGTDSGYPHDSNRALGGNGGDGGGIILIDSENSTVFGSGTVLSQGSDGQEAFDAGDSEPGNGGGGAGGSIIFTGYLINSGTINTSGGIGYKQDGVDDEGGYGYSGGDGGYGRTYIESLSGLNPKDTYFLDGSGSVSTINNFSKRCRDFKNNCSCQENTDCLGICGGPYIIDCSGNCVHNSLILNFDCNGACGGNDFSCNCDKHIDCNGVCGGDSIIDCAGVCGGPLKQDCKGICGGSTAFDCEGVCGGTNFDCECLSGYDCQGVCGGSDFTSCGTCHLYRFDCKGVCGGYSTTDCAGICGGNTSFDCEGSCGGSLRLDCNRTCGGDDFSCGCEEGFDCSGTCGGNLGFDSLGVCGGDSTDTFHAATDPKYSKSNSLTKIPKSKEDIQKINYPYLDCYQSDECTNCGGDTYECCENISFDKYKNSCQLESNTFCGYTSEGLPAFADACGDCFGSETDVSKCAFINNLNYITSSFNPAELCEGSCGYVFASDSTNKRCVNLDVCGQCGGYSANSSNCSSPENRPPSNKDEPADHCNFWFATWTNQGNDYSAWVKHPHIQDFQYTKDGFNYSCYRPKSIIGPLCPPDNFTFYSGGYTPCGNLQSINLSNLPKFSFSEDPFICESSFSCGEYPWGGCKFLDACGVCGGETTVSELCPGNETETEEDLGLDEDSYCFLVKGYWINERTGDMFSAWFNQNSERTLDQNFSSSIDGVSDCYVFLYAVQATEEPYSCSPPEDDFSPVYILQKPFCESTFYESELNESSEDLTVIEKSLFEDSSTVFQESPFDSNILCLSSPSSAKVEDGKYILSGQFNPLIHNSYGLGVGTYLLYVPESDPIILHDYDPNSIQIYGENSKVGVYGSGYYGAVFIKVLNDFGSASLKSSENGFLSSRSILSFKNSCSESCSFRTIEDCSDCSFSIKSILLDRKCSKTDLPANDESYKNKSCIDPLACNYDDQASYGSIYFCDYTSCAGCMDQRACNYLKDAKYSNCALCNYDCLSGFTCRDIDACNYNPMGKEHKQSLCDYSCYSVVTSQLTEVGKIGRNLITVDQNHLDYFCIGDLISININSEKEEIKTISNVDDKNIYLDSNLIFNHETSSIVEVLKSSDIFISDSIEAGDTDITFSCSHLFNVGDKILINEGQNNEEVLEISFKSKVRGKFEILDSVYGHSVGEPVKLLNPLNCYIK